MATDPTLPLQAALLAVIDAAIAAPVYDVLAPQAAPFPYVTIGELICTADDTKDKPAHDVLASIHAWSRQRTSAEAKALQASIYAALHFVALTVAGFNVTWCKFESASCDIDEDGITHHALARYRIRIEAA